MHDIYNGFYIIFIYYYYYYIYIFYYTNYIKGDK